jgi:DNA-binding CsgD family transcriptional regulator
VKGSLRRGALEGDPDGATVLRLLGGEAIERLSDDSRRLAGREGATQESTLATNDGRSVSVETASFRLGSSDGVLVTLAVRPGAVSRRMLQALARAGVSAREQEVACLAAEGLTNRGIAEHLGISPATVSVHLTRVFRKLDVAGRTALTRWMHAASS